MITEKLIENATNLVLKEQSEPNDKFGAAWIQRRFALGYTAATEVIEALVIRGVIAHIPLTPHYRVCRKSDQDPAVARVEGER